MKLIYGTHNQAKIEAMKLQLIDCPIEIVGLDELDIHQTVEETGKDPLENAIIKAKALYRILQKPLFSCDTGLYFENVADELQPGVLVRRVHGKELNDEDMIAYYAKLAKDHGGLLKAQYRNAICLIIDEDHIYTSDDRSLASPPFYMSSKPHQRRVKGFPLDSLWIDIKTHQYYYDLENYDEEVHQGFAQFFKDVFKEQQIFF